MKYLKLSQNDGFHTIDGAISLPFSSMRVFMVDTSLRYGATSTYGA